MGTIIDGKKIAQAIREQLAREVRELKKNKNIIPGLAVVLVGSDPASHVYVKNKRKACEELGIASFPHDLPATTSEGDLLTLLQKLNRDPHVHGILVQLPLPEQIHEDKIVSAIDPQKDIDGFHPVNVGKLTQGQPCLKPCTPSGVIALLDAAGVDLTGKRAVIVGRSNIVGKPVALLLLERHATVTICHSRTKNLADEVRSADIVVAAIGKPQFIKGDWIKPGAVVIDVGINRTADGKLVGDVEFDAAAKHASAITPVPGGVGPMTIAMLMKNVLEAAHDTKNSAV